MDRKKKTKSRVSSSDRNRDHFQNSQSESSQYKGGQQHYFYTSGKTELQTLHFQYFTENNKKRRKTTGQTKKYLSLAFLNEYENSTAQCSHILASDSSNCPTLFLNSLEGLHLNTPHQKLLLEQQGITQPLVGLSNEARSSSNLPNVCTACLELGQNSADFFPSEASTPVTRHKLRSKLCPLPQSTHSSASVPSFCFHQAILGKYKKAFTIITTNIHRTRRNVRSKVWFFPKSTMPFIVRKAILHCESEKLRV